MKFIDYKILLLLLYIFTNSNVEAQVKTFDGIVQNNKNYSAVKEKLTEFDVYQIDSDAIVSYMNEKTSAKEYIEFNLKLGDKHDWDISLFENDIRSDDYKITLNDPNQVFNKIKSKSITYQGYEGGENEVRLAITENFISGFVETGKEIYYIEPLENFTKEGSNDLFVVYTGSSVVSNSNEKCIFESIKEYNVSSKNVENNKNTSDCLIARIAIANDYQMYLDYNSNIQSVINQNLAVINAMNSKFDDEFNSTVFFTLVEQFFSTSPSSDPWSSTIQCTDLLNSFRNWTITSGFSNEFDFASLWTGRDVVQGPRSSGGCTFPFFPDCPNNRQIHILENSNGLNLNIIRQIHEVGHNFRGNAHNSPAENRIMDQNLGNNTQREWGATSVNLINNRIATFTDALSSTPCIFDCNCQEEITVSNTVTTSQSNQAFLQLNVRSRINNGASAIYKAGTTVILEPGFHARSGSTVRAFIGECSSSRVNEIKDDYASKKLENVETPDKTVSLFPNPAHDILHIESDAEMVRIEVMSQIGVLKDSRDALLDSNKGEFNISSYNTGVYFLIITFKDGSVLNKTVIKK